MAAFGMKVALATTTGLAAFSLMKTANASGDLLHPPQLPWPQASMLGSLDSASIRRGFEVYKNVCANCHSLSLVTFRHLVNVCYTAEEMKAIAEETDITDGPNDEGEMFKRPGFVTDMFPKPYENDQMARYINGGATPPDLTLMVKARHDGLNYVYALLTGYVPPPEGVEIREGAHYNPYFPGGTLSMAQALTNGIIEYEDGTPATVSQLAKDVTMFLNWTAEPEHDARKSMGIRALSILALAFIPVVYWKRSSGASTKSRILRFWN
eukprot:TRINITY_DN12773_c0_g1_i1.p2 TRINITY_DN12773_c0_g1~~TRINITY_DN12773_c0_g1_i1.p2  ORF type:complete len:267 (+),score=115.26 TRINITY_DN12773_c0_g1_i1:250-1050(+)